MSVSTSIGEGSYGCILRPYITCDGKSSGDKKYISKFFFKKKSYEEELKLQEKIKEIGFDKKGFTIKMKSSCKLNLEDKNNESVKELSRSSCGIYDREVFQIIFEFGGTDLKKLFKNNELISKLNKMDMRKFLKKFVNIFKGLCELDSLNLIHFDIRPDNILYDFDTDKFFIIDFGLMKSKDTIYSIGYIDDFYIDPHQSYPNELNILGFLNRSPSSSSKMDYEHFNSKLFADYISSKMDMGFFNPHQNHIRRITEIKEYIDNDINLNFKETLEILKKDFKKDMSNKSLNIFVKNVCDDIRGKIDVYMLGLVLYEFLINIVKNLSSNSSIQNIPLEIYDLIKDMIKINPCDRITIQEAYKRFKSFSSPSLNIYQPPHHIH